MGVGRLPASGTLKYLDGVDIRMNVPDHPPPHFHAELGGDEVIINLDAAAPYIEWGSLPRGKLRQVMDWCSFSSEIGPLSQ